MIVMLQQSVWNSPREVYADGPSHQTPTNDTVLSTINFAVPPVRVQCNDVERNINTGSLASLPGTNMDAVSTIMYDEKGNMLKS